MLRRAVGPSLVIAAVLSAMGAWAQAPLGKSPWCEKFDNTSEDHRLKTMVIPARRNGQDDADLLAKFELKDLLQNALAEIKSTQTSEQLLATMVESFRPVASDERNTRSHLLMSLDERTGESQLKPAEMLSGTGNNAFKPVGFFNRFDLASFPNGHCGEARIVFSKPAEGTARRMFLIFEGKVSPKDDENAMLSEADCRPVVEFWASLIEASGATRADILHKFYFDGDMGPFGKLASAPMSFKNLGGSNRGQVRGDLFIKSDWQLREWLLRRHGDRLAFDIVTVKDNPLAEFYDSSKAAGLIEPERGRAELHAFQTSFAEGMLIPLSANTIPNPGPAVAALPADTKLLHSFGFGPGATSQFDEFQSTSQKLVDRVLPDLQFKEAVKAKLPAGTNPDHIFNRAMALTCGGCHQPEGATRDTMRLEVSPNVFWPKSATFVHIQEDGTLSEALTQHFPPFRAAVMKDYLCKEIAPAIAINNNFFSLKRDALSTISVSSTRNLVNVVTNAPTQIERSIAQEAINDQESAQRRTERSEAGSVWTLRRTH